MKGYINGIDFYNLPIQKYYAPPNSWTVEKRKNLVTSRIFSGEWYGARKVDGAFYMFVKDEDGNCFLRGRSKSVSGEYLDKIDWVPQLWPFFKALPAGTCFLGELYLPSKEEAKATTSIMNCKVEKAVSRQEKEKLHYYVFDILADRGESYINMKAIDRFLTLDDYHYKMGFGDYDCVMWADYYSGQNLWNKLQEYLAEGFEGVVITYQEAPYRPGKRSIKDTLKIKKELQETIDCIVIGVNPPTKIYNGKEIENWTFWYNEQTDEKINDLMYKDYADGAPVIPVTKNWFYGWAGSLRLGMYKDGKTVQVGSLSGITDDIKENWKDYLGQVVEVAAMEVMDTGGIRHPKFVQFRPDKVPEECVYENLK